MSRVRPHVTVVLAMSADGKIADRDRTAARFSSATDLMHLETQVAQADAVLFGAGTLRAYGTCLSVRNAELIDQRRQRQQPDQPIQIVCSRSGQLDPNWRFFRQAVPRWLLTTEATAQTWQGFEGFDRVLSRPSTATWTEMLTSLSEWGLLRVAVLGGGSLVADLVAEAAIDDLYLTVCPLLLGGRTAPTPVDGPGLPIAAALELSLVSAKPIENEVFLHYRRCHPKRD